MTLKQIEEIVLLQIKYDRYSALSVDTDPAKVEDFSALHRCVTFAREEIKRNTFIPQLMKHATSITPSTSVARNTISDTDFDIPIVARYTDHNDNQYYLKKATPQNLLDKISNLTDTGDPSFYLIFDSTSAGLTYVELYPIPETAGTLDIDYKPVLSNLTTSTDEDIIMKKYPETVIKLATAWAWQVLKNEKDQFDKWILFGRADFSMINLRENSPDPVTDIEADPFLTLKRKDRQTI